MFGSFFHRDKKQYDWVDDYLQDDTEIRVSPYFWTRLRANIVGQTLTQERENAGWIYSQLEKLLPILLGFVILLGIFMGKELSRSLALSHLTKLNYPVLSNDNQNGSEDAVKIIQEKSYLLPGMINEGKNNGTK